MVDLVLIWPATTVASSVATVAALRHRARPDLADWGESLLCCAIAALPGFLLFIESAGRVALEHTFGIRNPPVYDYPSTLLTIYWILVGPPLFLVGYSSRPDTRLSLRVAVLGLVYFIAWATSAMMALMFAASI